MKRIYNYILLSVLAFAAAGCTEDEFDTNIPSAANGDEVQFGLSLRDPETRTIYGSETSTGFPIYWDQEDKVLVASPQCPSGRNSAEYEVTPESGQNYAKAMTRIGDYGVQWGNTSADFYSIYPSTGASWKTLTAEEVVANLNISSQQSANLVLENNVYSTADMDNVIMYARTANVANGETVNLNYKPYSTVLEFEMKIDKAEGSEALGSAKIVSMTLTALPDTPIAGDFTLKFNEDDEKGNHVAPTITEAGNNSNSISMVFSTQPVLNATNTTLKAKMALIPISNVSINNWTISIEVLEGNETKTKTYKKTLTTTATLAPGKIHKIKLPAFTPAVAWTYNTNSWITSLYDYKNIYLTELSIPGAWYSLGKNDGGYQAENHTAKTLWDAGVRAFAVECRSYTPRKLINIGDNTDSPTRVAVSGLGSNQGGAYTHQTLQEGAMVYISKVISDIAGQISEKEFGVLILSYADGGSGGHREMDYSYFINGLKTEIANSGATNICSKEITSSTTVNDVLGQLIIKINVDDRIPVGSYTGDMNLAFSYNPLLPQLSDDTDITKPLFSKLYWKGWGDVYKSTIEYNSTSTDFLWCFSSANRTQVDDGTDTDIPTYKQRKSALSGMIQHSKQLTGSNKHNVWFYFNVGGTEATSLGSDTNAEDAQNFAKEMNPWLLDVIKLKAYGGTDVHGYLTTAGSYVESDPSPLGIIMFNQCTGANATYYGEDIIKEIIEMNNKADLQRATPVPSSLAASYSSGMNDQGVSAFGWE